MCDHVWADVCCIRLALRSISSKLMRNRGIYERMYAEQARLYKI